MKSFGGWAYVPILSQLIASALAQLELSDPSEPMITENELGLGLLGMTVGRGIAARQTPQCENPGWGRCSREIIQNRKTSWLREFHYSHHLPGPRPSMHATRGGLLRTSLLLLARNSTMLSLRKRALPYRKCMLRHIMLQARGNLHRQQMCLASFQRLHREYY